MVGIIRSHWSPQALAANAAAKPGAPSKTLAGSWISDLVALGKAIVLCPSCEKKFPAARVGYKHKILGMDLDVVAGDCDWCGHFFNRAKLFLPEREC